MFQLQLLALLPASAFSFTSRTERKKTSDQRWNFLLPGKVHLCYSSKEFSCELLTRMSALALLMGGTKVALAAAVEGGGGGASCRQEIPPELIRDLWSRTQQLIDTLPVEEKFSRRLLPKFCTRCPERTIGWLELRELMGVYQRNVFSGGAVQKLLPHHYNQLLYRLQHTLQRCVSSSKPSKWFKLIKKLERKIKKKRDERALKAVREFTYVLRWTDELAHHIL